MSFQLPYVAVAWAREKKRKKQNKKEKRKEKEKKNFLKNAFVCIYCRVCCSMLCCTYAYGRKWIPRTSEHAKRRTGEHGEGPSDPGRDEAPAVDGGSDEQAAAGATPMLFPPVQVAAQGSRDAQPGAPHSPIEGYVVEGGGSKRQRDDDAGADVDDGFATAPDDDTAGDADRASNRRTSTT